MEPARNLFTPTEAAALTGVPVKLVRKEIEKKVIRPKRVGRKPKRVELELWDLFYLRVLSGLDLELPARVRTRLRDLIAHHCALKNRPPELVVSGLLTLNIGEAELSVLDVLRRFVAWRGRLVQDPSILGGEVVFPSSRLSVRHIGAVLERGESPEVVKEDYPYLRDEDLELARLYVKAYPHVGRPPQAAAR
jgi:uncharacterized protein (DUF433 family)